MRADAKTRDVSRLADRIGHTPLLPLDRIAAHIAPGVRIFAKAEWFNPGGSVKDRAGLGMLRAAEKAGLTKDRVLLDATSGNTGIAIAMLAAAEGYRATLCVPAQIWMPPFGSDSTTPLDFVATSMTAASSASMVKTTSP